MVRHTELWQIKHARLARATVVSCCVLGCLSPVVAAEAFVVADPVTGKLPSADIRIIRNKVVLSGDAPLEACDEVEFVAPKGSGRKVRITQLRGGKQIVLHEWNPHVLIACKPVGLSETFARAWTALAGSSRAEVRSASTRASGEIEFSLPVFDAPKSLIGAGRRALVVPWVGGKPPFRVTLTKAGATSPLCVTDVPDNPGRAQLPPVELLPGQYTVAVHQAGKNPVALEEINLFVVAAADVPRMPAMQSGGLSADETELLYLYHLEGLDDGRWTFEAVQRGAQASGGSRAIATWLGEFSGRR